jgi:hypothetical protein
VGKKAITEDSELAYYSFAGDREIFYSLINLSCISLNKKQNNRNQQNIVKTIEVTVINVI